MAWGDSAWGSGAWAGSEDAVSAFNSAWAACNVLLQSWDHAMRKNTASQVIGAQIVHPNGAAFTGSVTVYVTGDGGTQAAGSVGSGACTHEGNGFHSYAPAQAETNYDHIAFTFIGTGAVPATVQVYPTFPQTGDSYARIGAPAGASISADIAAIEAQTDDIGTAGAGLTAVPWNAAWDAEVQSEVADALAAYGAATATAADIADAVWDEATSGHTTGGSTGAALRDADLRGSRTVIRGTCASGGTTTTMTPSALSPSGSDADQFKGRILVFDNDTATAALRGQATDITASSAAALPVLTFTALTTAPASGDTFSIV